MTTFDRAMVVGTWALVALAFGALLVVGTCR